MYLSTCMPSHGVEQAFAQSLEAPIPKLRTNGRSTYKIILRIMKLTAIVLLVGFLHVSARTNAQERISISLKHATLDKTFAEIEKRSGHTVFYNTEVLKSAALVTLDLKDATIDEVMRQCLKGLPLEFSIQDKTIFVKHDTHKVAVETPGDPDNNPSPAVTTVVHGENGGPLAGASVSIVKLKKMGTTNAQGELDLKNVPDGQYELAVTYVGYERYTTTITVVNHQAKAIVELKQAVGILDAPVIIPYATTTQRLSTGDVSTVTSKVIEEQPVSNPLEALEGRVPGLVVTQTTGLPGGGFTVAIRGQNSIASGNTPFYVIDGVPYNSETPITPLNYYLYGGSPLNFVNPYDIESIEVLKDADATAIYGSRAANGAILITTKKGKAGGIKFDANVKSGITNPARTEPVLSTRQYLEMRHEAFLNDQETPQTYDYDVNGTWDTTRNTDWVRKLANKTAEFSDAEASVSGGTSNTQYLIGGGYIVQRTGFPTLLPGDGADKRGSVHFNFATSTPDRRFKMSLSGSYVVDKNTVQSQDLTNTAILLPPDAPPIFNTNGSLNWAPLTPGQTGTWTNPYSNLYLKYQGNTSNLVSNAMLSYTLLKGLELKASLGYTNTQTDELQTIPTTSYDPGQQVPSGHSNFNTSNIHSWIIEPQANYQLQLGKGVITTLVGTSFLETVSNTNNTYASGFISDALLEDIGAASSLYVTPTSSQYKYDAIYGRIGYNWMDKYLINLNARRDGTSRFGPGRQFGNFGAVGAGWIFTKEEFILKHFGFLSFGKLRTSYGTTGNDQVGDYQFLDLYNATYNPYQGTQGSSQGLYPTHLFNPLLTWETTKKLEGGIELGFLKDRIILQASIYRNRSGNELVQTPTSVVTGFSKIAANLPALVQNSGKEFMLNTVNIKTKNFGWTSSINLTIGKNKLLAYPNLASSPYANTLVIGQPTNVRKLFHCIGVNDTTGAYEFGSLKSGPTYNPNYPTDETALVNLNPKYFGGFNNSFFFKGFSLDAFFQFVKQTGLKLWAANGFIPGTMFNQPKEVLNRWQKPGDIKPYERFTQDYGTNAAAAFSTATQSDFAYGDASFIRLKNVAVSWQMPLGWVKKIGLEHVRIYLQGQNLLTITKYQGLDPETQSATTGPRRAYTGGLSIGW
jgi:TonB-linked SusC/RagA family outer membrane protein